MLGSLEYQKLAKEISDLDSKIFDLMEDNEGFKENIWELRFTDPLVNLMDGYDRTMKSADSLRKLMDDDTFLKIFKTSCQSYFIRQIWNDSFYNTNIFGRKPMEAAGILFPLHL